MFRPFLFLNVCTVRAATECSSAFLSSYLLQCMSNKEKPLFFFMLSRIVLYSCCTVLRPAKYPSIFVASRVSISCIMRVSGWGGWMYGQTDMVRSIQN